MIKFSELRKGNFVLAESDGQAWQGEITDFNNDEKEISVNNGIQDFWFKAENLYPIPLDEARLLKMNFRKVVNEDGSVKYMKDAFRLLTPKQDAFTQFEMWYKDEKRQIVEPIYLHQLQTHFMEMTKVHLTDSLF